jgi:hypothetical protein
VQLDQPSGRPRWVGAEEVLAAAPGQLGRRRLAVVAQLGAGDRRGRAGGQQGEQQRQDQQGRGGGQAAG